MKKLRLIFSLILILSCLVILAGGLWLYQLNQQITDGLAQKIFLPPTEYFAAPTEFSTQLSFPASEVKAEFSQRNYRHREWDQKLFPGDFTEASREICQNFLPDLLPEKVQNCLLFAAKESADPQLSQIPLQMIAYDSEDKIIATYQGNPLKLSQSVALEPELVAQYLENQPISQSYRALGDIPTQCLNAVMAIEDTQFLEHSGFSYSGFARAIWSHTVGHGVRSGGSTITQQLVKNYFLTSEKTLKRKAIEFAMSILLETHASKDEILETYLNVIYMGQNGPFQVRGFGAAAQYYFNKPLENLGLHECSLLAAVLNSPGLFDPFHKPENALKRRARVLDRMFEQQMISKEELDKASQAPLPFQRKITVTETAPYYIHAVNQKIKEMGLETRGLKIFTGLSLVDQQAAQEAVRNQLTKLETTNTKIKSIKAQNINLEGVLISADNQTGIISALVGGRSFKLTQFNRAIDGHRQVGSIMKPFVFLTALLHSEENGKTFDPLTPLSDIKFTYNYEGQSWSPDNYGKKYFGTVPAYFALKNSLNAATASLGLEVGLDKIIETARALGIQSELKKIPSLILGSFELYPLEILEAYVSLARFGNHLKLSPIRGIADQKSRLIYQHKIEPEQKVDEAATASLVSMMKHTTLSGSASLVSTSGFQIPSAGKTGTTSDNKDAWFAGFTPQKTAVVWVGYDSPLTSGLTGASGAVPIWIEFMKKSTTHHSTSDFSWPASTEVRTMSPPDVETKETMNSKIELVFKK